MPRGVTSVEDLPADLSLALDHANRILLWQENLPKEEMPPRWMWHLEWELDDWFEHVEQMRKEKYGEPGDDREQTEMMANDDPDMVARFGKRR